MKRLSAVTLAPWSLAARSEQELREAYEITNASAEAGVVAALQESLSKGIYRGASLASAKHGCLGTPKLGIEFPLDVQ